MPEGQTGMDHGLRPIGLHSDPSNRHANAVGQVLGIVFLSQIMRSRVRLSRVIAWLQNVNREHKMAKTPPWSFFP